MELAVEQYRRMMREVDTLAEELDNLRMSMAGRITGNYSGMAAHSGDGRGMENRAIHLAAVAERYNDALDELVKLRMDAESEIDSLEKMSDGKNSSGEILRFYYLNGMTLEATAAELGCDVRTVLRLKADALERLREVKT